MAYGGARGLRAEVQTTTNTTTTIGLNEAKSSSMRNAYKETLVSAGNAADFCSGRPHFFRQMPLRIVFARSYFYDDLFARE